MKMFAGNSNQVIGPIELLVLQPTPFCNLNCSYCYLRNRNDKSLMNDDVFANTINTVLESGLIKDSFTIVWHAGEPLVPGVSYYERMFEILDHLIPSDITTHHSFQTNGVLLNDRWCDFFNSNNNVRVGVSVDGPDFLHDRYRKTRNDKGTHKLVMKGIRCLQKNNIPFHTITVLTENSLNYPNQTFDFFNNNNITHCGFNIEEKEGVNVESSLIEENTTLKLEKFFNCLIELNKQANDPLVIRELEGAYYSILNWDKSHPNKHSYNQETVPMRIVNVDVEGNFSTFSPELHGEYINDIGLFQFGNVCNDSLHTAMESKKFKTIYKQIKQGIKKCKKHCEYYEICGGGSPSNKYFEQQNFKCDQTVYCQLHRKVPINVALQQLETTMIRSEGRNAQR